MNIKRLFVGIALAIPTFLFLTLGPRADEASNLAPLRWDFDSPDEISSSSHVTNVEVKNGKLSGQTEYDPFFSLRMPEQAVNAEQLSYLKARIYSSAPGDAFSIYYQSANGDWSLGASRQNLVEGWNVYTVDLKNGVEWGDASGPDAKVWGGRDQKVVGLRLDPGNQAGRKLEVDWVQLGSASGAPPTSWNWKDEGDLLGWAPVNFETVGVVDGAIKGTAKADVQLISPPLSVDADKNSIIEFKVKSDVGGPGEIFFRRAGESISEERQTTHLLIGDGQFHVYRVKMNANPQWTGTIEQIRFDPLNLPGAHLEIESLRFLPAEVGLVPNGGFARRLAQSDLPEDWELSARGVAASLSEVASKNAPAFQLSGRTAKAQATLTSSRFEFARTGEYTLGFDYLPRSIKGGNARVTAQIQLFDIWSNPLGDALELTPLALAEVTDWCNYRRSVAVPARAAYGKVHIIVDAEKGDDIGLDDIILAPAPARTADEGQSQWRASWIAVPDAVATDGKPRYFRRAFQLDDAAALQRAQIQLTADNAARLWINGRELPAGAEYENWKGIDIYDLKPFLKNGKNVIGVQTRNSDGPEGLLAEAVLVSPKAERPIFSDPSWQSISGDVAAQWATASFDATKWQAAQVIAQPPGGAWGKMSYSYLGATTALELTKFSLPSTAKPGEKMPFSVEFVPLAKPDRPLTLTLELAKPGATGATFWTQTFDTKNWRAGQSVTIDNLQATAPRYLTSGAYSLKLGATYFSFSTSDTAQRQFTLQPFGKVKSPVARVKYLNGRTPAIEINGVAQPAMNYMANNADAKTLKNVREAGINLLWVNVEKGFDWKPDGPPDFAEVDRLCSDILAQNPEAYLVINIPLDPVYNPGMKKWLDLYPNELVKNDAGSSEIGAYADATTKAPSYASRVWMSDAEKSLRALVRHVRQSPYGERVIGYVPISGISWEWFYWGSQSQEFVDYSEPFRVAFADWSKTKYDGDLSKANAAWKKSFASFDKIVIPSKEERVRDATKTFLDPVQHQYVIDLREFVSHTIAGDIIQLSRAVKEESNGESLCGTYYGYVMFVLSPHQIHSCGHFDLNQVLNSPDVDFLMSPARYDPRGMGGSGGFMLPVGSMKLHNKLYIEQADIRTLNATGPSGQVGRLDTLADSAAVMQREFANTLVNGAAVQWYDFGNGWIGDDARLMQLAGGLRAIEQQRISAPPTAATSNSIAVIVDENSTLGTGLESQINLHAVGLQVPALSHSGVGFDAYLLDDLEKIPPHKIYLFLNAFQITEAQRRFINANLKRDDNLLAWIYAPGISDGKTLSLQRASEISGIGLRDSGKFAPLRVSLSEQLGGTTYGAGSVPEQRFVVAEKGLEQWGVLMNGEPDDVGLVIKKFPTWTSVYSAAPNLPGNVLQMLAKRAGLTIANPQTSEVTYLSDRLLSVHTLSGGARVFATTAPAGDARELMSGQQYPVKGEQFSAKLEPRSTSLFLLPATP